LRRGFAILATLAQGGNAQINGWRTEMASTTDEFIPTRQSLLQRLKDWRDERGWQDFFDTYWRLIYSVARRAGLSDAEAQDVVQETVISVAKQIPEFNYNAATGSFKAWLMLLTKRRISDQFRKKQYQLGGKKFPREERLETALIENHPDSPSFDLENTWDQEWQSNALHAALQRVKETADPKEFQMFYLHVTKGIAAREVAKRLDVKLAQIYVAKYKVSSLVKKQIKILESKGL
jgi:RNA polymerase sigma factor (sigma-70 family)